MDDHTAIAIAFDPADRMEAKRLRQQEGLGFEEIAARLFIQPADAYKAVTGKTDKQAQAWARKHSGAGR